MAFTNKLLLFLSILFLVISLIFVVWLIWPQRQAEKIFLIPEVDFLIPASPATDNSFYTLSEGIQARLIFSERVQLGKKSTVDLYVEPTYTPDNFPAELLSTYNLVAETRLDWPLMVLSPDAAMSQPFELTHTIHFQWEILPIEQGQFEGKFWFYLMLVSIQDGLTDTQALLSVPITINVISLLHLTNRQIQMITFCLLIFSTFLTIIYCFRVKNNHSSE